jgi:hypothetical protein
MDAKVWRAWLFTDQMISQSMLWIVLFAQCYVDFGWNSISNCMVYDDTYRMEVYFFGLYLLIEYSVFLLFAPKRARSEKQILPRLCVIGLCGLFAILVIFVEDNVANGIPHDVMAALFGLGLLVLGILAMYVKGWYRWSTRFELVVFLGLVGMEALVGVHVFFPMCEYLVGMFAVLEKIFRIDELGWASNQNIKLRSSPPQGR